MTPAPPVIHAGNPAGEGHRRGVSPCAGFTLLEVMIALAILSAALLVLVGSQTTAVMMNTETERILTGTMLAREKMNEVQIMMEQEGFGELELEEEGDFSDFGSTEDLDLHLDLEDSYEDYRWAWTVRKVELTFGGSLDGMTDELVTSGFWGDQADESAAREAGVSTDQLSSGQQQDTPGLSDMGMTTDMITEMLGDYLREVRVLVWWGDNEEGENQVQLVSHIINPSGVVFAGSETGGESE